MISRTTGAPFRGRELSQQPDDTNGLLRQYFSKRTDLRPHSQADLDAIAAELNGRPRQILKFMTPSETYAESVC